MRLSEVVRIVVLFFALMKSAIGDNIVRITSESEFKDFESSVDSGTNYLGTTVYLSSDISFSEITPGPIGKDTNNYFRGVFDGQGYIINNLTMNSSSLQYMGLFGFSRGLTIRNVVLDNSCSVTSSYSDNSGYVCMGGVIGCCYAGDDNYYNENVVNMANISFSGNISSHNLTLGGIAGYLYSYSDYEIYVKNCANYGSVTHSGASEYSFIGGIVGYSYGYYSNPLSYYKFLQNCLNYGKITHSGTTSSGLCIGGVMGYTYYSKLFNCLSTGAISTPKYPYPNYKGGGIVGLAYRNTYLCNCYFTNDVGVWCSYGGTKQYLPSISDTPSSSTTLPDAVSNLNSYSSSNGWSKWLLNANNAAVTFKMSDDKELSFSSQVILIPNPVKKGNSFLFWCKDAECTEKFEAGSVSGTTELYAAWTANNYTVTFNVTGGDSLSDGKATKNVTFDKKYGELPEPNRAGYTFVGWFDENDENVTNETLVTVPKNRTLYAHWTANTYTVFFDMTGGDPLPEVEATKTVTFYKEYGELPEPSRTGYSFAKWFDEDDKNVVSKTIVTNPSNHTLYARWKEIPKAKEEKSKANTSFVVGVTVLVVVVVVVVVVAVVVIILFIFLKKKDDNDETRRKSRMGVELTSQQREEYCRVVAASMDETETNNASESGQSVLKNLYPQGYARPTMRDALLEAGLTEDQAVYVCDTCQNISRRALNEGKLFDGFTEGDAAAIAMYTYDFGPGNFESNPYRIINRSLVGRNYNNLQKASGLLYLVMSALRKLPRYMGKTLYRGVRSEVNLGKENYSKGNVIVWSALSSTSPDMETTKAFLAKESKSEKAEGTLFIIEGGWGYNIQPYSLFPDEVEILLEPERQFKVTGVIEAEGLTFINLQMLNTPLSIPEVFGKI